MNKKNSTAKAAATAALAGLMVFSFSNAENININEESLQKHRIVISDPKALKRTDIEIYSEEEYEAKRRSEHKKRIIKKIFNTAKGGAALLAAFAVKFILGTVVSLSGKPINSLLGFLTDILVSFIVIALLFAISFKIMYPEKKLKELFTLKNILLMLAASFMLTLLKSTLMFFSDKAYFVGVIIQSFFTLFVLSFLWYKIFNSDNKFGVLLKKSLSGPKGKHVFIGMLSATLLSAAAKLFLRKIRFWGAYCDLAMVFLICAVVVYCGYILFKPQKRVLLLN